MTPAPAPVPYPPVPSATAPGRAARAAAPAPVVRGAVAAEPALADWLDTAASVVPDRPWVTIVWDDPVNLMTYVSYVFMTYFRYPREKSERLMLDVHEEGRAVVSSGTREAMEIDAAAMHSYGLWATIEKDD